MKIFGSTLQVFEILFLISGIAILVSLPFWTSGLGLNMWIFAKIAYLTGIVFFIADVARNKHGA